MMLATWRRARIVLKFLFPDAPTRDYARKIRDSGLFDRAFYLRSNPRLRRLFRLAPERHYALFGEPAGLCPNPAFSPRAYLYNNPDITGTPPLLHFIETGRAEGRTILDTRPVDDLDLPHITAEDGPASPARVAVVLHLFYHDLWPEFSRALSDQVFEFDLFVTATGTPDEVAPLRRQISKDFPQALIWALPNHGRDIFPFLHLLHSGILSPYRAVCKLHGKRSPHRSDGTLWRQSLMSGVLGPPDLTQDRLDRFLADRTLGLWVADGHIHEGDDWWGINKPRAQELLQHNGWHLEPGPLRFPAGSIYWVKPAVLDALNALDLDQRAFEPEQAMVDGTTAHAVERLMGHLTRKAGLDMCEASRLDPR